MPPPSEPQSTTPKSITLKDEHRTQHIAVIGKTGRGKTTLLEHLILEDIRTNTSAVVIDPHGDLTQRIISLATPEQRQRITLLEVWPDRPFRLNLLTCKPEAIDRTVGNIITLFKRLFNAQDADFAPRLEQVLQNTLRTLIPNNGTLADIPNLLTNARYREDMLVRVDNPAVLEFWAWYRELKPLDQAAYIESTVNRLAQFLSSTTARAMISSHITTIPLAPVLTTDGPVLLIRIPIGELSDTYARFYGSLVLNLLTEHIFARSQKKNRHRLHLYLDEYGWFATSTTAALLQQARKYNLGATIAFQTLADLPDKKNREAALQVGTFIALQLTGPNADELVTQFPVIPRPESRETISEPVGTKPVRAISPNPVKDLITNGHSNKHIRAIIQAFLKPVFEDQVKVERSNKATNTPVPPRNITFPQGKYRKKHVSTTSSADIQLTDHMHEAVDLLNQLLISCMEQKQDLSYAPFAYTTSAIFIHLTQVYGSSRYPLELGPGGNGLFDTADLINKLAAYIREAAQAPDPAAYFATHRHNTNCVWTWLETYAHRYDNEKLANTLEPDLPYDGSVYAKRRAIEDKYVGWGHDARIFTKPLLEPLSPQIMANSIWNSRASHIEKKKQITEAIYNYAEQLEADAHSLISLCRILTTNPVTTLTGELEDDIRPRLVITPVQTHADARNELAGILATLAPFTAYYQTPDSHSSDTASYGRIALASPLEPAGIDEEAIEVVRERSKSLYGVPIEPPNDSPPALSGQPQSSPPRPPGPRIGRRSPDKQN